MYKLITTLVFVLLGSTFFNLQNLHSQSQEASNWYFGNKAAIKFTQLGPTLVHTSNMVQREGVSSVSDKNGNILFYTNGIDIWDKTNQIMPNGYNLLGHYSSTQSVLIVKSPYTDLHYYVFTNEGVERNANGFNFSIVDLTKNGGLGDVTVKNIQLIPNYSEKATAIYAKGKKSAWVVTHIGNGKDYYVYEITTSLQTPKVYKGIYNVQTRGDKLGYMKFFAGGTKLASIYYESGVVEIADFNPSTGVLSNIDTLSIFPGIYGADFSPDGGALYVSTLTTPSYVIQVDLKTKLWKPVAQNNPNGLEGLYGAIQVGIDGKVYVADNIKNSLSVINEPNNYKSSVQFKKNQISVDTFLVNYGLPNLPQTWYYRYGINPVQQVCEGSPLSLSCWTDTQVTDTSSKYTWVNSAGDTVGTKRSITIWNVNVNQSGDYTVYIDNMTGNFTRTVYVDIIEKNEATAGFKNEVIICDNPYAILELNLENDVSNYDITWSNGSVDIESIVVTTSGNYNVRVRDKNSCFDRTFATTVKISPLSTVDISADVQYLDLCTNPHAEIYGYVDGNVNGLKYCWKDENDNVISNSFNHIVTTSGKYYFIVQDTINGCLLEEVVDVLIKPNAGFEVTLPDTVSFCEAEEIVPFISDESDKVYSWSNGSTSKNLLPNLTGVYNLIVTDVVTGCVEEASVYVILIEEDVDIIQSEVDIIRQVNMDNIITNIGYNVNSNSEYKTYLKNGIYFKIGTSGVDILTDKIGEYLDTLVVESSLCGIIDEMPIRVENRDVVYITIPDTTVSIGDEICLDVSISSRSDLSDINIDIGFGFDSDVYYPISSNRIDDSTWTVCGLIVLTVEENTNMKVINVRSDNMYLDFKSKDGTLNINNICVQPLRQIQIGLPITLNINSDVVSYSGPSGKILEIFTINGKLLYSKVLNDDSGDLSLSGYNNGLYIIRIRYGNFVINERYTILR